MSGKTDDIAHDLQNGIDLVMDDLKKIRDKVPCSCGQEVSGDISVETALEMTTKDFYNEYEDVLKDLKEREVSVEV